ncbi:MAG: TonB-dependent receptor [Flammeovirgaceae bacterium]
MKRFLYSIGFIASILFFFNFLFVHYQVFAQSAKANVRVTITSDGLAVPYANISITNSSLGTTSDSLGKFWLKNVPLGEIELKISAIGFRTQIKKIIIKNSETLQLLIDLEEDVAMMNEVVVTGTMREITKLSSPVPIEVFSVGFLEKTSSPTLFEGLQIVNGVRPQVNCAVCNTGDIHINGMEGAYTMVLIDGMPIMSGLATVYGLNGIPNSMVERIEIVKGPASALYGSEAVGGLINVITKQPQKVPTITLDLMGTTWKEGNLDFGSKWRIKKLTSMLGVNYFHLDNPADKNHDGFTDVTQQQRVSVFNKWSFERKNHRVATFAARYVYEDRWGGQTQWNKTYRGSDIWYGESIYTNRWELTGQYQLPIHHEKVLLTGSWNSHQQNSYYGTTPYFAEQYISFAQLSWEKSIGKHQFLLGSALRYTYYDDNTPATRKGEDDFSENQPNKVKLPGIFFQGEFELNPKTNLLLGARYDYHSVHGNIFTPRLNLKWSVNQYNTMRLSSGTGFRVINLFTEDHAATTGAREVVLKESLNPEKSYNVNFNYQRFISVGKGFVNLDASLFYTYFTNKIVADYTTNANQIIYDNLKGHAVSQGITLNTETQFQFPLNINLGVTLMDVYQKEEDLNGNLVKQRQLLTERISGTFSVSYTFSKSNVVVDYAGNIYGRMKLPLLSELDSRKEYSPFYSIQNIKISKIFKNGLTIYGGIKNLLNFRPASNSIARSFDPFDKGVTFDADGQVIPTPNNPEALTFDPSYVYASFQGIRGFLGVKWEIK